MVRTSLLPLINTDERGLKIEDQEAVRIHLGQLIPRVSLCVADKDRITAKVRHRSALPFCR